MSWNVDITSTLSLLELTIGASCIVGLTLASALALDYALDVAATPAHTDERTAAVVGLRNALSLEIVLLLFVVFVAIAAFTPPPLREANANAATVSGLIFELMVLTMTVFSALNLRARFRIRVRRENGSDGT